jgi:hypothetical protein
VLQASVYSKPGRLVFVLSASKRVDQGNGLLGQKPAKSAYLEIKLFLAGGTRYVACKKGWTLGSEDSCTLYRPSKLTRLTFLDLVNGEVAAGALLVG